MNQTKLPASSPDSGSEKSFGFPVQLILVLAVLAIETLAVLLLTIKIAVEVFQGQFASLPVALFELGLLVAGSFWLGITCYQLAKKKSLARSSAVVIQFLLFAFAISILQSGPNSEQLWYSIGILLVSAATIVLLLSKKIARLLEQG